MNQSERTSDGGYGRGIKVCPHCGELLFSDMEVCYGCLYDFRACSRGDQEGVGTKPPEVHDAVMSVMRHDPLATIDLDEVELDEEPAESIEHREVPPGEDEQGEVGRVPRHRKTLASADDTLDLGMQQEAVGDPQERPANPTPLGVVVMGKEMEVRLPLSGSGLSVGRGEDNDIVLRSRLVSRHHLRIFPTEGGAAVEDCGATNPAELRGIPLEGARPMQPGDELRICETVLTLAASA